MYRNLLEPQPPSSPLPILPMDIIIDILCRLPVKTLLCFRCLSKQFRSLIDSPDFINNHLQFNSSTPKLILCDHHTNLQVQLLNFNTLDKVCDLEFPLVDWLNDFYKNNLVKVFNISNLRFIDVIGSSDGLLALSIRMTDVVILCNTSTRKHKILPICLCDSYTRSHFMFGFGRGAGFDDHKLVRVATRRKPDSTSISVYSFKTGSWRKIVDFSFCLIFHHMASFVKGTLNWLCCETESGFVKDNILSFDLNNDNFYFISLPDSIGSIGELILTVGGECLCLLERVRPKVDYNIWVMKEYGVKDSWIKLYFVSLPFHIYELHSFAFSKHLDKLFLLRRNSRVVVVWNMKEGRYEFEKSLLMSSLSDLVITFESLVSLGIAG